MKLEKWEDSVEELYTLIKNAKKPNEITMAKTMLRILARLADNEEQRREDLRDELAETLSEISSELWHGNCNDTE